MAGRHPGIPGGVHAGEIADVGQPDIRGDEIALGCPGPGEKIIDLQLGYEFRTGWLKGASLLLQMNNLTNAEFVRYRKVETNIVEQTRYGRTVLLGLNYRM